MDETVFNDKYWHSNSVIVTVANPRNEDYKFSAVAQAGLDSGTGKMREEQRHYRVPAGGSERFPGPIANIYLDQMTKLLAQEEDKIHFLIDYALKAQYYDRLTVATEDPSQGYQEERPSYLDQPSDVDNKQTTEVPFAEVKSKMGRPAKTEA
jgi:hypothetical protein